MARVKKLSPQKEVPSKRISFSHDIVDKEGKVVAKAVLPKEVFGVKVDPRLLSQVVRVYLANQRGGTRKAKTRGDVSGSTRKVYRQKGTGRARHGSSKAPIYIGGGVAHGPTQTDFSLRISKKLKQKALFGALSQKLQEGKLTIIRGLTQLTPKTKEMVQILRNIKILTKKMNALLVLPEILPNVFLAGRNIEGFSITAVKQMYSFQVLNAQHLIMMEEAVDFLKEKDKRKNVSSVKVEEKFQGSVKKRTMEKKAMVKEREN
ncbi:50S ribosomal protein L4 [Candidatus Gottesmanbacteria bacterium]|nr:50S ribosomal protein L4 [Candidatus Gottesmanbacteria bacterium]